MKIGLILFLAAAAVLTALPAAAACTDPAAPQVNWQRCNQDGRSFVEVDLTEANLRNVNFNRSDLSQSKMAGADLRRTKFVSAVLKDTVFDEANLSAADFTRADLTGASFRGANLRQALFFRAILRGADFTGAELDRADFLMADLSGATWIDGTRVCAEGSVSRCK